MPAPDQLAKLMRHNENLQVNWLKQARKTFPQATICCTWPVWHTAQGEHRLVQPYKLLKSLGYEAVLPKGVASKSDRRTLLYHRPKQWVGREIVILRPI